MASCWRDPRSAIGLGYDLLAYAASRLLGSVAEHAAFLQEIAPLAKLTNAKRPVSGSGAHSHKLATLHERIVDMDFAPHPEPSIEWLAVARIGASVTSLAQDALAALTSPIAPWDVWCGDDVLDETVRWMWQQPWLNPHEVTEIAAIARWRDATGKRTIPRGDRWLAFQSMIDAREINAAYIFATGAPLPIG